MSYHRISVKLSNTEFRKGQGVQRWQRRSADRSITIAESTHPSNIYAKVCAICGMLAGQEEYLDLRAWWSNADGLSTALLYEKGQKGTPHCMESEGPLPHSQQPTIRPYPKLDQFSPALVHFLKINFNIILSPIPLSSKWPSFPTKTLYAPLLSPEVLHASSISFFLSWSPE